MRRSRIRRRSLSPFITMLPLCCIWTAASIFWPNLQETGHMKSIWRKPSWLSVKRYWIPSWGVVPTCFVLRFFCLLWTGKRKRMPEMYYSELSDGQEITVLRLKWIMKMACAYFLVSTRMHRSTRWNRMKCSAHRSSFSLTARKVKGKPAAISSVGHANISWKTARSLVWHCWTTGKRPILTLMKTSWWILWMKPLH